MEFEWDDEKERINISKHKLSFSTAALVFKDPCRIEWYDEVHSLDEDRYITIGMINGKPVILMVVYTENENNVIRIISARAATKREKEAYYGKQALY